MLPTEVKVGAITYTVETKDFVEIDGNKNYLGSCDYNDTKIEISNELNEQRQEGVFVHELTHAIFNEAGYDTHDETMIDSVSRVLHQVLRDNPNLLNPQANVTSITIGREWDSAAIAKMTEELKNIPLTALQVKA